MFISLFGGGNGSAQLVKSSVEISGDFLVGAIQLFQEVADFVSELGNHGGGSDIPGTGDDNILGGHLKGAGLAPAGEDIAFSGGVFSDGDDLTAGIRFGSGQFGRIFGLNGTDVLVSNGVLGLFVDNGHNTVSNVITNQSALCIDREGEDAIRLQIAFGNNGLFQLIIAGQQALNGQLAVFINGVSVHIHGGGFANNIQSKLGTGQTLAVFVGFQQLQSTGNGRLFIQFQLDFSFGMDGGDTTGDTDQVLGHFTAGGNTVTIDILGLRSVEIHALGQNLSTGNNGHDFRVSAGFHGQVISLGTVLHINGLGGFAVHIDGDGQIILALAGTAVVQLNTQSHSVSAFLFLNRNGLHNGQTADNDLGSLGRNFILIQQEFFQSIDTVTNVFKVFIILIAVGKVFMLVGEIVQVAAPGVLLSSAGGLIVVIRVAAVLVCDGPDGSLGSGDQLGTVQLIRLFKAGFLQCGLCFFHRNKGVGICENGAELLGLLSGKVLAVFQVQTLIIIACFRTGSSVTAVDNIKVAFAAIVDTIRSPVAVILGSVDQSDQVHCTAGGHFFLQSVVAGFVVIVVVGLIAVVGDITEQHVGIAIGAFFYFQLHLVAVPGGVALVAMDMQGASQGFKIIARFDVYMGGVALVIVCMNFNFAGGERTCFLTTFAVHVTVYGVFVCFHAAGQIEVSLGLAASQLIACVFVGVGFFVTNGLAVGGEGVHAEAHDHGNSQNQRKQFLDVLCHNFFLLFK